MSIFNFYCTLRSKNHASKKVVKSNKEVYESPSKASSRVNKKVNEDSIESPKVGYTKLAVGAAVAYYALGSDDSDSDDYDD